MVLFLYHDSLGEVGAQVKRKTIAMTLTRTMTMSQTMTMTRHRSQLSISPQCILVCPGDNQCTWSCH